MVMNGVVSNGLKWLQLYSENVKKKNGKLTENAKTYGHKTQNKKKELS